jgi:hypothetical protein
LPSSASLAVIRFRLAASLARSCAWRTCHEVRAQFHDGTESSRSSLTRSIPPTSYGHPSATLPVAHLSPMDTLFLPIPCARHTPKMPLSARPRGSASVAALHRCRGSALRSDGRRRRKCTSGRLCATRSSKSAQTRRSSSHRWVRLGAQHATCMPPSVSRAAYTRCVQRDVWQNNLQRDTRLPHMQQARAVSMQHGAAPAVGVAGRVESCAAGCGSQRGTAAAACARERAFASGARRSLRPNRPSRGMTSRVICRLVTGTSHGVRYVLRQSRSGRNGCCRSA